MNLHEFQAKQIFSSYGLPVPNGKMVESIEEAERLADTLDDFNLVVKAQIHAGGRGKAGGVKLVKTREELLATVRDFLGKNLVTIQTDSKGQPINHVLIESLSSIKKEYYLSIIIDRSTHKLVIMASTEGGVDIEEVARNTPDKIYKLIVDPFVGIMPAQCRDLGFKLKFNLDQIKQFTKMLTAMVKLFNEKDLSMLEVNPLIVNGDGDLVCLDGKINIDDNALFRQPEIAKMCDYNQEDPRVNHAHKWELNYIPLDGSIGCMVNGAGLAMATMDIIKLYGAEPANFLDVGGSATKERVAEALKIILSDENVKGILVNIFGGIVRCDLIADGIIAAVKGVQLVVPLVVRLEGNNAHAGIEKLNNANMQILSANSLKEAAKMIVEQTKE